MVNLAKKYPGAALITGASAGLGEAFARHCAREGMDVVLVARRERRLELLAATLEREHGIKAHVITQDLAAQDAPQAIHAACQAAGITVSMLVNNAGFGTFGNFHETDCDGQMALVDVNCRVPVALANLFVPDMVSRKNGAVIFLASTAAYQPCPQLAVYGATKSFNRMLGEALWSELRPHGVDALALSPGYTKTEFHRVARVKRLPSDDMFRDPEHVVKACFNALGRQSSLIDRVTPLEAKSQRALRVFFFSARRILQTALPAGLIEVADILALI